MNWHTRMQALFASVAAPSSRRQASAPRAPIHARWHTQWERLAHWAEAHRRGLRRVAVGTMFLLTIALSGFVWAWNATPSVSGLGTFVRTQDARHGGTYTPLARISPWVGRALVSIEDEHFYQHHGIDTIGLLRAMWDDLRARRIVEGGSTLTEQLAKNAYLGGYDHTLPLKLEDMVLALKIEHQYSKGQILEFYLNLVYFGHGAFGVARASNIYFGVSPAHVDIAQAALLAGLVRAPSYYDPWCHPNAARMRQAVVLNQMLVDGYISPTQERAAAQEQQPFWTPGVPAPAGPACVG